MNKLKTIYVRLIDGTESKVPCKGVLLDKVNYKITENQSLDIEGDATSIWEFFPGDVVECEQRDFGLLASRLISSSFPDRKIHQLIFLLIQSFAKLKIDDLDEFKNELKKLCDPNFRLLQKTHPMVKKWLEENCSKK